MKPTHKAQVYQYSQDFFAVKTAEAADFANEFNLDLLDVDNVYWLNFHNLDERIHCRRIWHELQTHAGIRLSIWLLYRSWGHVCTEF
jgi:hypothetical protein